MASFFILFFPDIVKRGMLYIADPPLYQIDYKPQEYVTTKKIYLDISENIYNKTWVHVKKVGNDWERIKDSTLFRDAVNFNRQMRSTDIYRIDRRVMISIVSQTAKFRYDHNMTGNLDRETFKELIKGISYKFTGDLREIYCEKYNDYIAFAGVYNLRYMGLDLNYATYTKLEPLINTAMKIRTWERIYIMSKKSQEVMTSIAEDPLKVIETVTSVMPKIKDRMKGLGQTNKEILARTTLDPATRTLIRVDINDNYENTLDIIKMLRGSGAEDLQGRKKMISEFDIDADDIDN